MTGMLASVSNLDEAILAQDAGVDIIDLKAPSAGSLGSLDTETVQIIVGRLKRHSVISATIGDLPLQPDIVGPAVDRMWKTGVNYVKIGLFPGGDWDASIGVLQDQISQGARLIAVFFADCCPDTTWFHTLARAGFSGVMLDTKDKRAGSLRKILDHNTLERFVEGAHALGLLCGLAGSLRLEDIGPLLEIGPDYLGFRGALCRQHDRVANLDPDALHLLLTPFHTRQGIGDPRDSARFAC